MSGSGKGHFPLPLLRGEDPPPALAQGQSPCERRGAPRGAPLEIPSLHAEQFLYQKSGEIKVPRGAPARAALGRSGWGDGGGLSRPKMAPKLPTRFLLFPLPLTGCLHLALLRRIALEGSC